MLGTYASLVEAEAAEVDARRREPLSRARRAFLWEHLLSWLPVYLDKLAQVAPPFYRRWAEMLRAALDAEADAACEPSRLPLQLREASGLADPRASSPEEFLRTILAPARSGLILLRDDLARCARATGTGIRAGERLFALRALLGHDAAGVLGWLAREADGWESLHLRRRKAHGRVAAWWGARARATARLLRELEAEADDALRTV
jgi:hypothetical protein